MPRAWSDLAYVASPSIAARTILLSVFLARDAVAATPPADSLPVSLSPRAPRYLVRHAFYVSLCTQIRRSSHTNCDFYSRIKLDLLAIHPRFHNKRHKKVERMEKVEESKNKNKQRVEAGVGKRRRNVREAKTKPAHTHTHTRAACERWKIALPHRRSRQTYTKRVLHM